MQSVSGQFHPAGDTCLLWNTSVSLNVCFFCRPLKPEEALPVRTHRIVSEQLPDPVEPEEKKKHKKKESKKEKKKKKEERKEEKEKVMDFCCIIFTHIVIFTTLSIWMDRFFSLSISFCWSTD